MVGRHAGELMARCVAVEDEGGGGDRRSLVEGEPGIRGSVLRASDSALERIRAGDAADRLDGESSPDTAGGPLLCAARPDG